MKLTFALEPDTPGRLLLRAAWCNFAIVSLGALLYAAGLKMLEVSLALVCLASLVLGLIVWTVAFLSALGRTTRGDEIAVSNWVFLAGSAPVAVRTQFLCNAALLFIVTCATTASNPFVWLANLLPLGLSALWSSRHGTFPARHAIHGRGAQQVQDATGQDAPRGRPSK